jgi:hypothetical protein
VVERLSRDDAKALLGRCLDEGEVIPSKHFRAELENEGLEFADAFCVLKAGQVYREPEPDIKTGDWKYTIEGPEPGGMRLAIVFCFKRIATALLITVFSVSSRSVQ